MWLRDCTLVLALTALTSSATAQAPVPDQDSLAISAIRHLGAVARSGPLRFAELRGLPLNNPATFTLATPVPDRWTCGLRIDSTMVTAKCDVFVALAEAEAEYQCMAAALHEGLGRKGWVRNPNMRRRLLAAGFLQAESYHIKRDRLPVAGASVWLSKRNVGVRSPGGADHVVTLTVTSFVNRVSR